MLERLTIAPARSSRRMRLTASRVQKNVPFTLTSMTREKPSSVMCTVCSPVVISLSKASPGARSMPALLIRMSMRPNAASTAPKAVAISRESESAAGQAP